MADSRMRDHVEESEESAARARGREPDRGDVASAFFAEHLDLDAIRRALGQRAVPGRGGPAEGRAEKEAVRREPAREEPASARAGMAPDTAAEAPPLGRDLSSPPPGGVPEEVALAAPPREQRPMSRRVVVLAPALLGGLVAVAMSLTIGPPGIPSGPGGDRSEGAPVALMETAPVPAPELTLAAPSAPSLVGDTVRPSPVPGIPDRATIAPLPVPDKPPALFTSAPAPRMSALVGDTYMSPGDMARRPDLAPIRFALPADLPTGPPSAPKPLPKSRFESHAGAAPVLARETLVESTAMTVGSRFTRERLVPPEPRPMPAAGPPPPMRWTSRAVVHLRRAPGMAFRARLTETLRRAGFERVEWRTVAGTVNRTQTRYFHDGDAVASERAAAALAAQGRPASVRDFTHYDPPARHGTIEIWLSD